MSENKVSAIVDLLRTDILGGKCAPGSALPSVKMLCRRFGVSHLTAVKAVESLKRLGLVKCRNGVGTFVARRMTKVGLIMPMVTVKAEIYPPICQEFSRICMERGVSIDFVDISSVCPDRQRAVVVSMARRMVADGVSGVVFHPVDFGDNALKTNREVMHIFKAADIPLVILDSDVEVAPGDDRFDFVGVDNLEIGQFAGRHVIERGARKIAFAVWRDMNDNVRRRLAGLMSAIAENRDAKLIGTHIVQHGEAQLAKCWKAHLPDAIVCASDMVAAHVIKVLGRMGKQCPRDVIVTGVNDVEIATLVSPTLTTVRQPSKAIASTAFETLLWRLDNPDAETRRIMVAAELVVRESTAR